MRILIPCFALAVAQLCSPCFAESVVSKESSTQIKVATTTYQIASLKEVREQRQQLADQLVLMDERQKTLNADFQNRRAKVVSTISGLDQIIQEAKALGVKDEKTP